MKAVVATFNQQKALVGAFSVSTNLRMELFEALVATIMSCVVCHASRCCRDGKFVEAGNQFWFPDDVTLGYIIGECPACPRDT